VVAVKWSVRQVERMKRGKKERYGCWGDQDVAKSRLTLLRLVRFCRRGGEKTRKGMGDQEPSQKKSSIANQPKEML